MLDVVLYCACKVVGAPAWAAFLPLTPVQRMSRTPPALAPPEMQGIYFVSRKGGPASQQCRLHL